MSIPPYYGSPDPDYAVPGFCRCGCARCGCAFYFPTLWILPKFPMLRVMQVWCARCSK